MTDILVYDKDFDDKITNHFKVSEFKCRCKNTECDKTLIHPELLFILEKLRMLLQEPISINSGYRCPAHNKAIGGAPKSKHILGQAADITAKGFTIKELYQTCDMILGDTGGLIDEGSWIHIDVRETKYREIK